MSMTYTAQVKVKAFCLAGSAWLNGNMSYGSRNKFTRLIPDFTHEAR